MKLFLGLILLFSCTFIGYVLSLKFVKKKEYYNTFLQFNTIMKNEVAFSQSTISNVINSFERKNDFYDCVASYFKEKKFVFKKNYITNEEIDFFYGYLSKLGTTDKKTQLSYLEHVEIDLEKKLTAVLADEKKYRFLYVKLGFLFGLIAFIVCL